MPLQSAERRVGENLGTIPVGRVDQVRDPLTDLLPAQAVVRIGPPEHRPDQCLEAQLSQPLLARRIAPLKGEIDARGTCFARRQRRCRALHQAAVGQIGTAMSATRASAAAALRVKLAPFDEVGAVADVDEEVTVPPDFCLQVVGGGSDLLVLTKTSWRASGNSSATFFAVFASLASHAACTEYWIRT